MLRGTNRAVIEVSQLDNEYFEKVILFVRVSARALDDKKLEQYAREYAQSIQYKVPDTQPAASSAPKAQETTKTKTKRRFPAPLRFAVKWSWVAVAVMALALFVMKI